MTARSTEEPADKLVKNMNGLVLLLPFLEQAALYEKYDFRQCASWRVRPANNRISSAVAAAVASDLVDTSENGWAISQKVPAFICPSDPNEILLPAGKPVWDQGRQ